MGGGGVRINKIPNMPWEGVHGIGSSENIRGNSRNRMKQIEIFLKFVLASSKKSLPHDSHCSGWLKKQALFIMKCKGPKYVCTKLLTSETGINQGS